MSSNVAPFEFLWIVKESAYGTPMASPAAGVDSIFIRLSGANRFTMRPEPVRRAVGFGGGYDVPGYSVSDQMKVTGKLSLELCYTQSALLVEWAINRITGGTAPWTTTEPNGDLASCSVYHGVMRSDGTIKRRQYPGCKVHGGSLKSSADTGLTMLDLDLVAQKMNGNTIDASADPTSGAFAVPADTAFPVDPILFFHAGAGISVGGSALSFAQSVELAWTNKFDARFFSSHFLVFDRLRGREATATIGLLYTASPDWRTQYEAITSAAASFAFTNTTHTLTIDYRANVLVSNITDDLTPGKVYDQALVLSTQWDTSTGDIVATFS